MRGELRRAVSVLMMAMICLLPTGGLLRSETPPADDEFMRIEMLIKEQQAREAEAAARQLLTYLDQGGSGGSIEAARAIDLLLKALHIQRIGAPEAVPLARRSMEIWRSSSGTDSLAYASSLYVYARWLINAGRPREAKPLYEEALVIQRKVLGPDHAEVGRTLGTLAHVYEVSGEWSMARDLYERSLAILEAALGLDHRDSGILAHQLGELLEFLGDYDTLRQLLERRLRAFQGKTEVPARLNQVRLLSRIAATWEAVGEAGKARESCQQALEIWNQVEARVMESVEIPPIEVANTLARLAVIHSIMGEITASEDCYLRAISVREMALGPDHPDIAWMLVDLADMLSRSGKVEHARPFMERACQLLEKPEAVGSLSLADCLLRLGLMKGTGAPDDALSLMTRGVEIQRRVYGQEHPDLAWALTDQARLELATGRDGAARSHALEGETIARNHFQKTASWLSEREALRFEQVRSSGLDIALSSLVEAAHPDPVEVARVWDAVVRSRALVLDELAARRRVLLSSADDTELSGLVARLEAERNRVARFVATTDTLSPENYQTSLRELLKEREAAERAVAVKSASFRRRLASREIDLGQVIASLPERFALVAYVRYERTDPSDALGTTRPSYLALVAGPADRSPALVPLGDAPTIDRLVYEWREKCAFHPLEVRADSKSEQSARDRGDRLRRAIWDPVADRVAGAQLVLIVPDGSLHLANLAALPDRRGGYLVESDLLIHQISAERDLVRPDEPRPRSTGLLALGGPDYDRRTAEVVTPRLASRVRSAPAAALGSLRFDPLPAAVREVEQIAALWRKMAGADPGRRDLTLLTRWTATEGAVKSQAAGHRVVHFATHGFIASPEGQPSLGSENPLLAAGLALAGANTRSTAGADQEDGLLLAEEIASLDFSGVEWIVLSSCESALGSVREREGVLGMRRAFEAAGAGTLIMSLWQVEDEAARLWMMGLYQARLNGLSTAASMRRASVERIQSRRARSLSTHPFFWGAFVAAGDWR